MGAPTDTPSSPRPRPSSVDASVSPAPPSSSPNNLRHHHHGAGSSSNNAGASILSDKVARALEVRTDTAAMRAALEALANLPSAATTTATSEGGGGASGAAVGGGVVDGRSVRVAIERDALRQAELFEAELRKLVNCVKSLREGASALSALAGRVSAAATADVVSAPDGALAETIGGGGGGNESDGGAGVPTLGGEGGGGGGLEEEQNLAAILSDAFRERDEARARSEAVNAFLEKFDLSEEESDLLERYDFDGFEGGGGGGGGGEERSGILGSESGGGGGGGSLKDGMAFLDALERVRRIRLELSKTFGGGAGFGAGGDPFQDRRDKASSSSSSRLGATSAVRMMENLASKQERAYERLYRFLQSYLRLDEAAGRNVPTSSAALRSSGGGGGFGGGASALPPTPPRDEDEIDESLSHPLVRRSLHALRHVPAFRSHALELIAASRRSEVTRRFLLALTSGHRGSSPIEMKAHDPVNYVGDMLAFAFRSLSVEADIARGLVEYEEERGDDDDDRGDDDKDGEEPDAAKEEEDHSATEDDDLLPELKPMTASDMLSVAVSGLARPLRSRVSQVVASLARRSGGDDGAERGADDDNAAASGGGGAKEVEEEEDDEEEAAIVARTNISALYSIAGLLLFYRAAFEKTARRLLDEKRGRRSLDERRDLLARRSSADDRDDAVATNPLVETASQCLDEACAAYGASVRVYSATLPRLSSLSAESESTLAKSLIVEVSEVRIASPGFSRDVPLPPPSDDRSRVSTTLSIEFLVDSVMGGATIAPAADDDSSSLRTLDDASALRSALTCAKKAGLKPDRAAEWERSIEGRERAIVDDLVEAESAKVLDACGLLGLTEALQRMEAVYVEGMTMSSHPGLSPEDVGDAMGRFHSSLYAPPLPSFEYIKDGGWRKYSRARTATRVAESYKALYEAITSDKGGYDDLSFLSHDPEQVKTLLSA